MALMIIEMNSDLHLQAKLMSRPVEVRWPKSPERRFSSVTKSNIAMER